MNDGLHQRPLGVDEKMPLLALDLLSRIEPESEDPKRTSDLLIEAVRAFAPT
jgi:hypothetical protein